MKQPHGYAKDVTMFCCMRTAYFAQWFAGGGGGAQGGGGGWARRSPSLWRSDPAWKVDAVFAELEGQ